MKALILVVLLSAVFCFTPTTFAQARDAVAAESQAAEDLARCNDDPECRATLRNAEARTARAEEIFAAKPWYEKLLPWILMAGGFWVLWKWVGRSKPKSLDG